MHCLYFSYTPTATGLVPLSDQFNTAVETGDRNVKCGYLTEPYNFQCWTTRDVKAGEEVRYMALYKVSLIYFIISQCPCM